MHSGLQKYVKSIELRPNLMNLNCVAEPSITDSNCALAQILKNCYSASAALSTHLLSSQICYQSSVAINNFAIDHHLLSNFRLPLNPYFCHFFLLKIYKENGKIFQDLEFFILWQTFRGHLLPQIKVSTFWKILKTTKTRHTIHWPPTAYMCQKYRNGCKARSCSTKGIQRTGLDSNLFRKQQVYNRK